MPTTISNDTSTVQDIIQQVDWDNTPDIYKEISKFIFTSKYARYREDLKRRETFDEAVERVESMHLRKFDHLSDEHKDEIRWAFDLVREKKVGPSMRSMQFGGPAVEAINLRQYNCSVTHIHSIRSFAEVFYLLLCGAGVGMGLTKKYLNRLPNLVDASDKTGIVMTYVVEDSIKGWADSVEALLNCYFINTAYTGRKIVFDYSRIRPAGSPLKTSGGKAPGHEGLKAAHIKIKALLDHIIENNGQHRLRSIDAYDILMHVADAVLSGGIRRAATSILFDKDDEDMINAKTGNWFEENPQRARSNNSVLLVRDQVTREEFLDIYKRTREWGEPGYAFVENEDTLLNPCFEIAFVPVTDDGVPGVQVCNLTTINGSKIKTEDQFYEASKAAAIIGTLQAAYTDFPYLTHTAEELTKEEALLGVSMTGMMDAADILFDENIQTRGAEQVVATNARWAEILGINPAARTTCVKPEGTSSLVFETMASGIHPSHAKIMWRRIQANKLENPYQHFKQHNPHLCEESLYSANKTDDMITFPVKVDDNAITKKDLSAIEHLEMIKSTQKNWVVPGRTERSRTDLHHSTSCTVVVQDHEWEEVGDYLYDNRDLFSAVSLIAASGDKAYPQAPNEEVVSEAEARLYVDQLMNFMPVDYTWMNEEEDNTSMSEELACAGPQGCDIVSL